ncbi:MAG: tetratricopeptide repeat protein, partial [Ensifer adhaerens]|nr:tetratricopeptide repeat protein [Ensifer adhaerens]
SECYLRDWHGEDIAADAILSIANEALSLDATLSEAHAARGFALFCDGKYAEAEAAYQRALSIDPNSYDANFLSGETMGRLLGDRERLISTFKLTTRLRSDDYFSPMQVASILTMNDPEQSKWARLCFERAERAASLHPENAAPLHRGALALAYLGEREKAHSWLARALSIDADDFVTQYNAACMHSVLGETEAAIRHLERAVRNAGRNAIYRFRTDADFNSIRDHPRYIELVASQEP